MRRMFGTLGVVASIVLSGMLVAPGVASADPSASDWLKVRQCESGNRYNINTGNGYYGAYQFDLGTWKSVGGTGYPHQAGVAEQDYRALRLYRMRGWSPWICAALVGVREDSDAKSGVLPPANGGGNNGGSTPPSTPTSGAAPAYPGNALTEGISSTALVAWQKQMGSKGYGLTGTGYFGPRRRRWPANCSRRRAFTSPAPSVRRPGRRRGVPAPPVPAAPVARVVPRLGRLHPGTDASCSVGKKTAPAFKGTAFMFGDVSTELQCFQRQLGKRGYGLTGTGYYGSSTKAAVIALQKKNGLQQTGTVGPQTWKAAWRASSSRQLCATFRRNPRPLRTGVSSFLATVGADRRETVQAVQRGLTRHNITIE